MGYLGYVTGPVLIGAAASYLGLGHAVLILPALATLLALAARVVGPTPRAGRSKREQNLERAMGAQV